MKSVGLAHTGTTTWEVDRSNTAAASTACTCRRAVRGEGLLIGRNFIVYVSAYLVYNQGPFKNERMLQEKQMMLHRTADRW
mmetsp:Transcript_9689/g.19625  ORF Transcript_9689/g.19625 Transcript_9689/m.19625 type:complete len:81 (+) Transcript_9689:900-1142(+)